MSAAATNISPSARIAIIGGCTGIRRRASRRWVKAGLAVIIEFARGRTLH